MIIALFYILMIRSNQSYQEGEASEDSVWEYGATEYTTECHEYTYDKKVCLCAILNATMHLFYIWKFYSMPFDES